MKWGMRPVFGRFSLGINDARSLSYTQAGVEIPTIQSAAELYKKMFLQGDRKAMEAQLVRLQRKASILDVVMAQSSDLSKRVSASDRERIDQFQTAVRSLEQRLTEAQAWETRPRPKVDEAMPKYPEDKKQFFEMVRMMNDMSRLAFQTDSTRVITLFLGGVRTPGSQSWRWAHDRRLPQHFSPWKRRGEIETARRDRGRPTGVAG